MRQKNKYATMFTLRSDGRYQGHWRELVDGQPTGKRHAICDTDPERLYNRIQALQTPKKLTFRDIAEAWKAAKWDSLRPGTHDAYLAPYNRAVEMHGELEADKLMPCDIAEHLRYLAGRDFSKRSVGLQKTIYSLIYAYAMSQPRYGQIIHFNPATGVAMPSDCKAAVHREAPEDEVVDMIRARSASVPFGIFALFLMFSGLRRGEALSLRWADIDFTKKEIRVDSTLSYHEYLHEGKTKTDAGTRSVPLLQCAEEMLLPMRGERDEYIFHAPTDKKKPMPQSTYKRAWLNYCISLGMFTDDPEEWTDSRKIKRTRHHYKPTITAHHLRHGYATMLFEADVDVYTAKQLLGHANVETTIGIYTHLRQRKKQSSLQKLVQYAADKMIGGSNEEAADGEA